MKTTHWAISVILMMTIVSLSTMQSQTYEGGNTYYPNGTSYLSNATATGGQGPAVLGPPREDGSQEGVDCDENPKRCKELLEEAADDAAEGSESSANIAASLPAPLRAEWREYQQKLKIRAGVWQKANNKWTYVKDPRKWAVQVAASWGR